MHRRTRPCWLLFLASLILAIPLQAVQAPAPDTGVLPDYDSRSVAGKVSTSPQVSAALERLRGQAGPLTARINPLTGGVRLLSAQRGFLTARASGAPAGIVTGFLAANADILGLNPSDVQSLVRTREYSGFTETITHIDLSQFIGGIRVFEAGVKAHVARGGEIVFLTSNAVPLRGALPAARLSAAEAALLAVDNIRPEVAFVPQVKSGPSGPDQATVFAASGLNSDVTARLVFFPHVNELRTAWQTYVEPQGFPQAYVVLIDAVSGELLLRRNTHQYAEGVGNVHQSDATAAADARLPDESPKGPGNCPPVDNFLNRDLNSQFRDPATVLGTTGRLQGNNVHVWRSNTGAEGALGTQDGGGVFHFDFGFNTASGIETHLFFASNFIHDFFYDLGFDEASGNFQENNFGRGGLGADSLNANARAPGRNNANFSTPPDGAKPTMNMFLWDGVGCWAQDVDGDGTQDLDGDLDMDIVYHEFHHGVSHRLNTSFGGNEAGAIGEGGSDFFAYTINNDTNLGEYSAPPNGIRSVNAKTYANWTCIFGIFCEPHDNGEIWANVMWDIRERYRTDLTNGTEAASINESHLTYINGLRLSPANPTMLELRDSMLQDDLNRNASSDPGGSENYCRLWDEFAGRGMGLNAQDTKDTGSNTVVADFTVPAVCLGPPVPPAAPSNLVATVVHATRIDLTWTDNSNNEDGFRVERCTGTAVFCDANPLGFAQIAQTTAPSYSDTSASASTTYSYRVKAFNGAFESAYSNTAEATTPAGSPPAAPSGLTATPGSSGKGNNAVRFVDLRWTDNSNNEDNFVVERCSGSTCTNFITLATLPANTTTFRDSSVARRTTYRYRVKARNAFGESASNIANAQVK